MTQSDQNHAANIALAAALSIGSGESLGAEPPQTPQKAAEIVQNANRAAVDIFSLTLTNSFNPNARLNTNGQEANLGVSKDQCEKAASNSRFLVDLTTYKAAQHLLIDSGQLTSEAATKSFAAQADLMKVINKQQHNIVATCGAHGVSNFKFPNGWN